MTESVLLAGHVLVAEDTLNTPYISPRIASLFPTRSNMALPLIANGRKLGAAIVSYHQTHHFAEDEIALGEQAAGQIAVAIDKVWRYDEERQRNTQLVALQSVSRAVASSLNLNQIFSVLALISMHWEES